MKNIRLKISYFRIYSKEKKSFFLYIAEDEYWIDISTHERYLQTHHNLLSGKIKNVKINRDTDYQVADSAEIDDKSCLANGCRIGSNVKIVNSVLGEKVIVEDAAVVQNLVI